MGLFRDNETIIQIEVNMSAGRRRTSWLFTSMAEDLNLGL